MVSPEGCRNIGAGYAWSPNDEDRKEAENYGITPGVASAILEDAIKRELKAFGGRTEFLHKLAMAGVVEKTLPAQLQAKLSDLRSSKAD